MKLGLTLLQFQKHYFDFHGEASMFKFEPKHFCLDKETEQIGEQNSQVRISPIPFPVKKVNQIFQEMNFQVVKGALVTQKRDMLINRLGILLNICSQ